MVRRFKVAGVRALAGGVAMAGSLLLAGQMAAQTKADAAPAAPPAAQAEKVASILDRHSDLTPEARAAGSAAFARTCAACHDHGVNRAPPTSALNSISPGAILRVITDGKMKEQAAALSPADKTAVAEYLSGRMLTGEAVPKPLMCKGNARWFDRAQTPAFAGWGLNANNDHAIPGALAGLNRANVGKLRLRWALAFPDAIHSRAQAMIAAGAIFVGGDDGTVYALDPQTGCAHWTFHATGPVRMGLTIDPWKAGDAAAKPLLYFGDMLGNAYAIEAATGTQRWRRRIDAHANATLTGAPALRDGKLYWPISSLEEPAAAAPTHECCTFRGSVVAIDSGTGAEKWRAYMVDQPQVLGKNPSGVNQYGPSGAAIWSTPLVDPARGLLYVTTGDNYSSPTTDKSDAIVAVDIKSGAIRWSHQASEGDAWNVSCGWVQAGNCPKENGPDHDFGAAPIMARGADGKDYLLAGQKSGSIFALDPASGKLRWTRRIGHGGTFGGIHFGIAAQGGKVFVPVSDLDDGSQYDGPAAPGVYALDVATGKIAWSAPAPSQCGDKKFCYPGYGAAISVTPDLVLAGAMDGHIRALDAATGKILWDRDTDLAFQTVNGTQAHGGSLAGGAAPIAWHGKLIVNSGYGGLGKMPGNVMLVFDVE